MACKIVLWYLASLKHWYFDVARQ